MLVIWDLHWWKTQHFVVEGKNRKLEEFCFDQTLWIIRPQGYRSFQINPADKPMY